MHSLGTPHARCLTADPRSNRLPAALPEADWRRWQAHLELVKMPHGASLCGAGELASHVYFPTTAIVCLQHITRSGDSAEIATIGSEGLVGVSVIMGGGTSLDTAVVCGAGHGFRISSARLQAEFHGSDSVKRLLLLYVQALMTYTAQTAVCNRHHALQQRLCRCLLTNLDRAHGPTLSLTHECMASQLGVRREGVTAAAQKLQRAGVIEYARGRVAVLDRPALESQSCECYAVVRHEYRRLLPQPVCTAPTAQGAQTARTWQTSQPPTLQKPLPTRPHARTATPLAPFATGRVRGTELHAALAD